MFLFHKQLIAGELEDAKKETFFPQSKKRERLSFSFRSEKVFFSKIIITFALISCIIHLNSGL